MTVSKNPLKSKVTQGLFPKFDDPRRKFVGKVHRELTGGLETGVLTKVKKPKTKRPRRRSR